jgi:Hemocyanin, ig-like domain
MNTMKNTIIGRTRRMDTKQFTVTVDVQSNKNQNGIVRIFLGPRINNKQQLDDNRQNFVEIDQFIVKLNQGQNVIKRNSRDFKNVVGEPETMKTLYFRALNLLNKKTNGDGNDMNRLNFDTNNNNQGFPHRLVLPKGTVGGEDYTLFVVCSDLNNDNNDRVQYRDNLNTFNLNGRNVNNDKNHDSNESNDSNNSSNDSNNSSNESNDSNGSDSNENGRNGNDRNGRNGNDRNGDNKNRDQNRNGDNKNRDQKRNGENKNRDQNRNGDDNDRNMGRGNWEKNNGVMIHNTNNGNKNCGNGNGVLDTRAMGFPLDRQIIDVTGFITNNMFFKDVTIFHIDNSNNN